jgi:hypothetical protein
MEHNQEKKREAMIIARARKDERVRNILTTFLELDEAGQLEFTARAALLADRTRGINISRSPSKGGKCKLTSEERQQLRSASTDGVIPFDEYLRIMTEILNKGNTV